MIVIAPKVPVMTIRDSMINIIKLIIIMATMGSEMMDMSFVGKKQLETKTNTMRMHEFW